MGEHRPARSTVEANRVPKDALIEIDVIATRKERGSGGGREKGGFTHEHDAGEANGKSFALSAKG
ncbi:MAG: hypothetical protein K0R47_2541 [Brevibacillus sp.]|jgi:hypothetical protein|nr:hypothetical protein [Brevibacillus sp.]